MKFVDENEPSLLASIPWFLTNQFTVNWARPLDNPTFRGMRWSLTQTFSSIYVLDLHGNSKKKEVAPDGGKDENVFNIQQGVAIILGVKNKASKVKQAKVYRADLWGRRKYKFGELFNSSIKDMDWKEVKLDPASYSFTKNQNQTVKNEYEKGVSVADLFPKNVTGIVTMGDSFIIDKDREKLKERILDFLHNDYAEGQLKQKYNLGKNYAKWILENKKQGLDFDENKLQQITYRPFDTRWIYFDNKFVWRTRGQVMKQYSKDNLGLLTSRMTKGKSFAHCFTTQKISEVIFLSPLTGTNAFNLPLYLYEDKQQQTLIGKSDRQANLDQSLVKKLLEKIGKYNWIDDHEDKKEEDKNSISPLDILDYVYAFLHSPDYRQKYKDFLKTDFPKVPKVKNQKSFWHLVKLGGTLRQLHLLQDQDLSHLTTSYPIEGSNLVEKVEYKGDKIFINEKQCFGNVPKEAWEFYIGGYQPAQKWLKDRKGEKLDYEDIIHYQRMVLVLVKTDKIMKK